ncbi:hypothetical protein BC833DRAFT_650286 [Globomyces pollinis-pini]|nr:hypothetical protein BC833DRAFT_650286 [Globomyces pollinis-pini]
MDPITIASYIFDGGKTILGLLERRTSNLDKRIDFDLLLGKWNKAEEVINTIVQKNGKLPKNIRDSLIVGIQNKIKSIAEALAYDYDSTGESQKQNVKSKVKLFLTNPDDIEKQIQQVLSSIDHLIDLADDSSKSTSVNQSVQMVIDGKLSTLEKELEILNIKLSTSILNVDVDYSVAMSPESVSFWRDRIQPSQIDISSLPFERYVASWARFVRMIELHCVIPPLPIFTTLGDHISSLKNSGTHLEYITEGRKMGGQVIVSQKAGLSVQSLRFYWRQAFQRALDPYMHGYVHPEAYFNFLKYQSLSMCIYNTIICTAGIGCIVECKREQKDLQGIDQNQNDYLGMTPCKILALPDGEWYAVQYLQSGQTERKRNGLWCAGGFALDASISIQESRHSWTDSVIKTLKVTPEGYVINDKLIPIPSNPTVFTSHVTLGFSKEFITTPKVGQLVQCKRSDSSNWIDAVYKGPEVYEFLDGSVTDTDAASQSTSEIESTDENDIFGGMGFLEDQNHTTLKVRPYKCLDIGDTVEAPLSWEAYNNKEFGITDSQVMTLARIVDVQGDKFGIRYIGDASHFNTSHSPYFIEMSRIRPASMSQRFHMDGQCSIPESQVSRPEYWQIFKDKSTEKEDFANVDEKIVLEQYASATSKLDAAFKMSLQEEDLWEPINPIIPKTRQSTSDSSSSNGTAIEPVGEPTFPQMAAVKLSAAEEQNSKTWKLSSFCQ